MGHGGTLDPLAAGVLIVGIGRGTKQLQQYLACSKTYETVVLFGASTDTYDCTGTIIQRAASDHMTKDLVEEKLAQFRGKIMQAPPLYSALKIDGIKACEYARQGRELPRALAPREMQVEECTLLQWYPSGAHDFAFPGETGPASTPAARIRLTVCSGFYVRSFAHDLGLACHTQSHMASLLRTRQANFTIEDVDQSSDLVTVISYADLDSGEQVWAAKLRQQLQNWVQANPVKAGHVDGRSKEARTLRDEEQSRRPRQRFRGGYIADTKKERIKQQGGKWKGKWGPKLKEATVTAMPSSPEATQTSQLR
jgi:tRNA pseudouridine55 synthase